MSFHFILSACATSEAPQDGLPIGGPTADLIPKAGDTPTPLTTPAMAEAIAESQTSNEIMSLEAKPLDCTLVSAKPCDLDEPFNPFQCKLIQNNQLLIADEKQITAWGDSRCLAKSSLEAKLCEEKIFLNGGLIDCQPTAVSTNSCEASFEDCKNSETVATKCFAKEVEGIDVSWTNRPEASGKSECEARNNLKKKACEKGLAAQDLKTVVCEKETSPLVCPPVQPNCLVQTSEIFECRIKKVGEVPLKEALRGYGTSQCEASYRVKDLACRWQRKELKEMEDIECRSVSSDGSFQKAAKAKVYKKIRKL